MPAPCERAGLVFGENDLNEADLLNLYSNGSMWYHPVGHWWCILQVLPDLKYCLLAFEFNALHGGTCLNVITDEKGVWLYDHNQIPERLKEWERREFKLLLTPIYAYQKTPQV